MTTLARGLRPRTSMFAAFFSLLITETAIAENSDSLSKPASSQSNKSVVIEVSSGGVSLGSYQGGYLLGRTLRVGDSSLGHPKILTGASAGAINTLGGLYYAFHPFNPNQTYSPYTEWLHIDWLGLTKDSLPKPVEGLLNTALIDSALNRVVDSILLPPDSSAEIEQVQIGFAITRLIPEQVYPELGVLSIAEKMVVRIRWLPNDSCPDSSASSANAGKGCYQAWTTGYGDPEKNGSRPVNHLWFGRYGTDITLIRHNLVALTRASSAFPMAFPPAKIHIYNWDQKCAHQDSLDNEKVSRKWESSFTERPGQGLTFIPDSGGIFPKSISLKTNEGRLTFILKSDSVRGRWEKKQPVKFSDGGRFENQPLELAMKIRDYPNSVAWATKSGDTANNKPLDVKTIRMLSPMHYRLKETPPRIHRAMTAEWFLALTKTPDPTSQEVLRALERKGVEKGSIELNTTILPLASEYVFHFSGFFERRFRRFDFLAGFFDALDSGNASKSTKADVFDPYLEHIRRIDSLVWMERFLKHNLNSTPSGASLFIEARIISDSLQKLANENIRDKGPIDRQLDRLDSIQRQVKRAFTHWTEQAFKEMDTTQAALFEDMELLQVLYGSLKRLQKTIEIRLDSEIDDEADRYVSFEDGLQALVPCESVPDHSRREIKCLDIHQDPTTGIDDVYLQVARFLDKDSLGLGNSVVYPFALYHSRVAMGRFIGKKPRWSAPYLRLEGSSPGFTILQGHSLLRRDLAPIPVLDLFRWEIGFHASWDSTGFESWVPLRLGAEIPFCTWFSLVPSWTWSKRLWHSDGYSRFGVDALIADLVHVRCEFPKRYHPEITAGIRIGFDPVSFGKGVSMGTNKHRTISKESSQNKDESTVP